MAKLPKTLNIKIAAVTLFILLLLAGIISYLLQVPTLSLKLANMLKPGDQEFADQLFYVADAVFPSVIAIVFLWLAFVMMAIPIVAALLGAIGIAVAMVAVKKWQR